MEGTHQPSVSAILLMICSPVIETTLSRAVLEKLLKDEAWEIDTRICSWRQNYEVVVGAGFPELRIYSLWVVFKGKREERQSKAR